MKFNPAHDLLPTVVTTTVLLFLMVGFIISYFIIYRKKRQEYKYEMRMAKEMFEKQLLRSQLEIQEQTFNQISQEIHDNVGQVLSLARIQINIMNESDRIERSMLNEIKENIGKAMTDLRDIARSLNSERIRNATIYEAVLIESERINKSGVIRSRVVRDGMERGVSEQNKFILFRMIQECMQNILKHAEATEMSVQLCYLPDALEVIVRDDGKGFDPEVIPGPGGGIGLANLRTRAAMTGGSMAIASERNKGTIITIKTPYE